jgi:hypothetical protein
MGLSLLAGCKTNQPIVTAAEAVSFATPTTHPFFSGQDQATVGSPRSGETSPGATPQPTRPTDKNVRFVVYNELLNSNWTLDNSYGMAFQLGDETVAHRGDNSIAVSPRENYGALFFTVREDAKIQFPRERVLAISFWLYSGDDVIEIDDLLVQVQGSNENPYWTEDDNSAGGSREDAFFSATRLYYLGITNTIPPETWVKVELWLDNQVFDSDYKYLTGFAVFNDEMFLRTYYIDEVEILMLEDNT